MIIHNAFKRAEDVCVSRRYVHASKIARASSARVHTRKNVNTKIASRETLLKSRIEFLRRKREAVYLIVVNLLEDGMENGCGARWWRRGQTEE